jgi:FtsH-like protein
MAGAMRGGEMPADRRCYREVGGAACRCAGFRDSGEAAIDVRRDHGVLGGARVALFLLVLVFIGIGLLYAYRSQSPALSTISYGTAIAEVNAGQVARLTIVGDRATLQLRSGEQQQTTLPDQPAAFQKVLDDSNSANPPDLVRIPSRGHVVRGPGVDIAEPASGPAAWRLLRLPIVPPPVRIPLSGLALRREARAEFILREQVLAGVAEAAGRKDVLDPVRATAGTRHAVILLEWSDQTAVSAGVVVLRHELPPLPSGEGSFRAPTQRPMLLPLRSDNVRIRAMVGRDPRLQTVRMPRVARSPLRPVFFRMRGAPALHRCPRLLRVAAHPLTPIGAPLLRIRVRQEVAQASALN